VVGLGGAGTTGSCRRALHRAPVSTHHACCVLTCHVAFVQESRCCAPVTAAAGL
jgi:hypothetical protein